MISNPVFAITNNSALPVTNFTADMTPPALLFYNLNIDSAVFTFSFSEVVDYSSFDPTQLTLLSIENTSAPDLIAYTITGGRVRPVDNTVLYLDIDIADLNEIKRLATLAISENATFISFTSNLVADTFNNSVVNVTEAAPVQVSEFTPDSTSPIAVSFTLDVNQGHLNLTFDDTMLASSFDSIAFRAQSTMHAMSNRYYTLTSSTTNSSNH